MFYRIGAPVDFYTLEDLRHPDFPEYKLYVFLNAWAVDRDLKIALDRLKKNRATFVWFHAPGIILENKFDPDNVSAVCGIQIQPLAELAAKVEYRPQDNVPFLAEAKSVVSGISGIEPLFYPVGDAVTFGRLVEHPAGAVKDFGAWRSIYFSAPVMTPELLRKIAADAGCGIYNENSADMLYIGGKLLGIHTGAKGFKTIGLPGPCRIKDLLTDEILTPIASEKIEFQMETGETRLFEILP